MKHTLYKEYEWDSHWGRDKGFKDFMSGALSDGNRFFNPAKLSSMDVQLNVSQITGTSKHTVHATITYDDVKDKETSASNISGGRSIPVPTH